MRLEAKHEYFTKTASIVNNFRNVALSLAKHHQWQQALRLSSDFNFEAIEVGPGKGFNWYLSRWFSETFRY